MNFNDSQKGIGETGSFGTDCVELKSRTVSSLPKTSLISKQGKMKNKRLRRGTSEGRILAGYYGFNINI